MVVLGNWKEKDAICLQISQTLKFWALIRNLSWACWIYKKTFCGLVWICCLFLNSEPLKNPVKIAFSFCTLACWTQTHSWPRLRSKDAGVRGWMNALHLWRPRLALRIKASLRSATLEFLSLLLLLCSLVFMSIYLFIYLSAWNSLKTSCTTMEERD